MLFLCYALLTLNFGFCMENKFEIKTVTVGENVSLTCPIQTSGYYQETLYWIRLVSGNWPEFLGATFNFEFDDVSSIPHIQTKQEEGAFLLHINEARQKDTGLYYCIKVRQLDFIFMNGTFLKVKGKESDVTAVIQEPLSGAGHPEKPEPLQCLVLSDSEQSCPAEDRVYWFRAGSDNSHPSLLYLQGNSGDECEKSPVAPATQKCSFNFSETSDAATYHCAVATCGHILFGHGTKLGGPRFEDFTIIFLSMLCSALVISLAVISCLIYKIKKKTCGCDTDPVSGIDTHSLPRDENALVYSAPMFNKNKAKKGEKRRVKTAQEETVYTDVKTLR